MSMHTSVFPKEMFQGPPNGYIKGWEKGEPIKNKGSAERSPVKGKNPNGPRNTSRIVTGPLFGNSPPRNSLSPRTPTPRTPRRNQTPRHRTPLTPRKQKPTKRRFANRKTPRSTRRRR